MFYKSKYFSLNDNECYIKIEPKLEAIKLNVFSLEIVELHLTFVCFQYVLCSDMFRLTTWVLYIYESRNEAIQNFALLMKKTQLFIESLESMFIIVGDDRLLYFDCIF